MCIKPTEVQHMIDTSDHRIQPALAASEPSTKPRRISRQITMPKKYHPYHVTRPKKEEAKGPKVVCKNVGSNGTIFIVQDELTDEDSNDNLHQTVVVKEEEENVVDVEKVEDQASPQPFVLSAKVQEVNNKSLKQELLEEPGDVYPSDNANNKTTRQDLSEPPVGIRRSGNNTPKPQPAGNTPNNPTGIVAFVSILLHALKCSDCEKPACRKMIMVLKHYKSCAFKRNSLLSSGQGSSPSVQNCKICGQLLRIVAQHAKFHCELPANQMGCPVLMCDAFRKANATSATNRAINNKQQMKNGEELNMPTPPRMPAGFVRRNGVTQPV